MCCDTIWIPIINSNCNQCWKRNWCVFQCTDINIWLYTKWDSNPPKLKVRNKLFIENNTHNHFLAKNCWQGGSQCYNVRGNFHDSVILWVTASICWVTFSLPKCCHMSIVLTICSISRHICCYHRFSLKYNFILGKRRG